MYSMSYHKQFPTGCSNRPQPDPPMDCYLQQVSHLQWCSWCLSMTGFIIYTKSISDSSVQKCVELPIFVASDANLTTSYKVLMKPYMPDKLSNQNTVNVMSNNYGITQISLKHCMYIIIMYVHHFVGACDMILCLGKNINHSTTVKTNTSPLQLLLLQQLLELGPQVV